jgi:hypothetical protein
MKVLEFVLEEIVYPFRKNRKKREMEKDIGNNIYIMFKIPVYFEHVKLFYRKIYL